MFDKQFLQILAVRLSGGLSLDWNEPEPRDQPASEEETIRRRAREVEKCGDTMPV